MKTITHVILAATLVLPTAANAQQPSTRYAFHTVAQSGTIIGGQTLTGDTAIGNAVLNDSGEVAFIACGSRPQTRAVMTSRRIVIRQGDVIDGKYIPLLAEDVVLAINNAGQVAYEAWYADTRERELSADASGRGIFVENHLVSDAVFNADGSASSFIFTDDGRIVVQNTGHAPAPPKNAPARIGLKLPRESVSISTGAGRAVQHKQSPAARTLLTPFPTNHRGQILIPVNFDTGGFVLLLGTPGAR